MGFRSQLDQMPMSQDGMMGSQSLAWRHGQSLKRQDGIAKLPVTGVSAINKVDREEVYVDQRDKERHIFIPKVVGTTP